MRFRTTLQLNGKTATGIPVPEEIVEALGSGRKPAVTVTVNGHTYRSTVAQMGGGAMLPLAAEHRTAAGVAAGDEIEVTVELDTAPRTVEVPADLAAAIAADPAAQAFYDTLSYSNKRGYVEWVESAKKAETRAKRLGEAVVRLRERRTR
jgi:hypothetical protein